MPVQPNFDVAQRVEDLGLDPDEPIYMLNLLRFKQQTDFDNSPDNKGEFKTGEESYWKGYWPHIMGIWKKMGVTVPIIGKGMDTIIGESGERWDAYFVARVIPIKPKHWKLFRNAAK